MSKINSMTLPDCMLPDGGHTCNGYHELYVHSRELEEEFNCFITQYGCDCNHPACTKCADTKDAKAILNKSK